MNLPQSEFPLLAYAEQCGISHNDIMKFIAVGGVDYFLNAWIAYSVEELKKRELLDNLTPVGGLELGRQLFNDIGTDFQEQLEAKAKLDEKGKKK